MTTSIVDYLKGQGRASDLGSRKKLAQQYGIQNYRGTAAQNTKLLGLLRAEQEVSSVKTEPRQQTAVKQPEPMQQRAAESLKQAVSAKPAYAPSQTTQQAYAQLKQKEAEQLQPYASAYSEQIGALLQKALEREAFSYDHSKDPRYQNYAQSYMQQGKLAMQDTVAAASALTGGYANSYAATAGEQAYDSYLAQLNEIIPTLYDSAYKRYQEEYGALLDSLGLLQSMDASEYQRYRDTVADYYADLNYYFQRYGDLSEQEYAKYMADLEQWNQDRAYYYQKQQDAREQQNWQAEFELAQAKKTGSNSGNKKSASKKTEEELLKSGASGTVSNALSHAAQQVLAGLAALTGTEAKNKRIADAQKAGRISKREAEILKQQIRG